MERISRPSPEATAVSVEASSKLQERNLSALSESLNLIDQKLFPNEFVTPLKENPGRTVSHVSESFSQKTTTPIIARKSSTMTILKFFEKTPKTHVSSVVKTEGLPEKNPESLSGGRKQSGNHEHKSMRASSSNTTEIVCIDSDDSCDVQDVHLKGAASGRPNDIESEECAGALMGSNNKEKTGEKKLIFEMLMEGNQSRVESADGTQPTNKFTSMKTIFPSRPTNVSETKSERGESSLLFLCPKLSVLFVSFVLFLVCFA